MAAGNQHKVLWVENDRQDSKLIKEILESENLAYTLVSGRKDAISHLSKARSLYSVVIYDQKKDDRNGIQDLEQARQISPDTQRFLVAEPDDINIIINAVNKGAVQKYIRKPVDRDIFLSAIRSAVQQNELLLENEKLLRLAKKQNTQLYELNCQLMEKTTQDSKARQELEQDIQFEEDLLKSAGPRSNISGKIINTLIKRLSLKDSKVDPEKLNSLFNQSLYQLYGQFKELAQRNGFEITRPEGKLE